MADATTIIAIAGGIAGFVGGGGGIVSVIQMWRQARRERTLDFWESYERQIKHAEARKDDAEVQRVRREYEGQLEAWRAQQKLVKLAPKEISAVGAGPSLAGEEVQQLKRLLAESAALSPTLLSAKAYFLRGNAYYEAGEYQEALAAYNRSLGVRPDDPAMLNRRGMALSHLGQHEQALADFNRSLDLRADDANILNNRGNALSQLGQHEEAVAAYNRSLELRPDDPDTLNNRGTVLADLGRHEEALADFSRALELRPNRPDTLYNRARLFVLQGKIHEAIDDLGRAIAGDAQNRQDARADAVFEGISADPRFRALVEGNEPPQEGTTD